MSLVRAPRRRLPGHTGAVHAARFTRDGRYCVTCGADRTLRLWNPHKDDPMAAASATSSSSSPLPALLVQSYDNVHGYEVLDVAVLPDNSSFASAGGDRVVFLWDVAQARVVRRFQGHEQRVNSLALNQAGTVLISGSYDSTVRLWDLRSHNREPIQVLRDFRDSVTRVTAGDGVVVAGGVDGCVRVYDLRRGVLHTDNIESPVTSICMTHDGKCVAASCLGGGDGGGGCVRLLEMSSGKVLKEYAGHVHTSYRLEACVANTDAHVVSGSEDGNVVAWNLVDGTEALRVRAHGKCVLSVDYHPGEEPAMLTSSFDGTALYWTAA